MVLGVNSLGLGAGVDALRVLAHAEVGLCLADVGADEGGVDLDGLVAVVDGAGELEELDEGGGAVAVAAGVLGRALDHLAVRGDGAGEVGVLELLVALLTRLLGLGRVDVSQPGLLGLPLLSGAELVQDIGCAVLSEGLVEILDGIGHVALALVGRADTGVALGDELEVGVNLAPLVDGLCACLNTLVEVALLKVCGAEVVEVGDVLEGLPGLGVVSDGLVKVALLVVLGAKSLLLVGRLLGLLLLQRLVGEILGLGLGLGSLLGRLGLGGSVGHGDVLGRSIAGLEIDAHHDAKDLQHPRIAEKVRVLRVLLDLLELGHERRVGQEGSSLGVRGEFLDQTGVLEHLGDAGTGVLSHTICW